MKINKTEKRLLDRLTNDQRSFSTISHLYGRGPEGGVISEGRREVNALNSLINKKILKRLRVHSNTHYENGYCVHISTIEYTWRNSDESS